MLNHRPALPGDRRGFRAIVSNRIRPPVEKIADKASSIEKSTNPVFGSIGLAQ